MEKIKLAISSMHALINGFCRENSLGFSQETGRPPRMSFAVILTIYIRFLLGRRKDFSAFYFGSDGMFLREIFPEMTSYSAFLRRIPLLGEILEKVFHNIDGTNFFILDSTSFKLCEDARFYTCRLFPDFAGWAHSSTRKVFGFKLHIAIDGQGKIVAFRLTNGNRQDIKEAENLLRRRMGTAIGDKGHCSSEIKERLAQTGIRFNARARENMKNGNTEEEKNILKQRSLVKRIFLKLKRLVGDSFSRFRSWGAAQATIVVGMLALNLWIRAEKLL